MSESYKFHLSFRGQLVENSVDAFDVANTILAVSQSLQEIADIHLGDDVSKHVKLNINAFREGSLETGFNLFLENIEEISGAILAIATNVNGVGKQILDGYKTFIEIKKLLGGKPPKEIKPIDGQNIRITSIGNATINITYNDLRALQSKTLSKNTNKAFQPLSKEDSLLDNIVIGDTDTKKMIEVSKEESAYFESTDEFQLIENVKYKGIVTKIDTKTRTGYLSVGSKRFSFAYPSNLEQNQFELLAESLKKRIQIYLVGKVQMNYESEPKNMQIEKVESDLTLFE